MHFMFLERNSHGHNAYAGLMEKEKSQRDEEQVSLSSTAAAHFKARNYDKCLENLQKLKVN